MLNIVLFGPPGAGKGTQSEKLIEKYELIHLSTGDLLRSEIAAGTQLGLEAQMLMNAGVLVPDEVVIGMISSKLDKNPNAKGFIFDGFPRTEAQAEALDRLLFEKHTSITMMLALEVSNSELIKRLLLRGQNSGRPDDQNEGIIRKRIEEYNNKTSVLKSYYSAKGKYRAVEGTGSVDQIFANLCVVIDPRSSKPVIVSQVVKAQKVMAKIFPKPIVKESREAKKVSVAKLAKPTVKIEPKKVVKNSVAKKITAKKVVKQKVKKLVKKIVSSNKVAKKITKKVAKKLAPKKVVKKVSVKKIAKKVTSKKLLKKVVKKATPQKGSKKVLKKVLKKVVKKVVPTKKTAKKVAKKKR